jgi:hypothetical protein
MKTKISEETKGTLGVLFICLAAFFALAILFINAQSLGGKVICAIFSLIFFFIAGMSCGNLVIYKAIANIITNEIPKEIEISTKKVNFITAKIVIVTEAMKLKGIYLFKEKEYFEKIEYKENVNLIINSETHASLIGDLEKKKNLYKKLVS